MKKVFLFLLVGLLIMLGVSTRAYKNNAGKATTHEQPFSYHQTTSSIPSFPENYGTPNFDNPDYYYAAIKSSPSGISYYGAGFNPLRTKIVANKDNGAGYSEIVMMNADGTGEEVISPGNSGTGDIVGYWVPFWSDDGTAVGFVEIHNANPNKVIRYDVLSGTRSYIYEPVGSDVGNPDFLGNSTSTIVFWDWISADGAADLFTWDGTTLTNITNSTLYSEYEPVSNNDGTIILYWSGETTTEPVNTTHTLTYTGGSWVKDFGFTAIADTYWGFWSGQSNNNIGVVVPSAHDVHVYNNTGSYLFDVTGPGYSGGASQRNYIGRSYEGNNGEILLTSNAGRTEPGRDIIIANPRVNLFVDATLGSDLNPGTIHAPFATIGKAITEAVDGSTVNVAAGTYQEQLTIEKNITIHGAGNESTIVLCPDVLSDKTMGSGVNKPIVYVNGANASIENLKIDARNPMAAYPLSYIAGIAFNNAGGLVDHVHFAGNREGDNALYYAITQKCSDVTSRNINIENCRIDNFRRYGIDLNTYSPILSFNIESNEIFGDGIDGSLAQLPIRIQKQGNSTSLTGSIVGNTISDIIDDGGWAQAITLGFCDEVIVSSNLFENIGSGIYSMGSIVTLEDNVIPVTVSGSNPFGVYMTNAKNYEAGAQMNMILNNNTITLTSGEKGTNSYGVFIYGGKSTDNDNLLITASENIFEGFYCGVYLGKDVSSGTITSANFSMNEIKNNGYGIFNSLTTLNVIAANNWWGSPSGPYHPTANACGHGNEVSDNVDFTPYWGNEAMTAPGQTYSVHNITQALDYCTIQEAINAAASGNVIHVDAGTYTEQVTISDKSLSLIGDGVASTTIMAPTSGRSTIVNGTITWDYVVAANSTGSPIDVKIEGFTIDANGQGGSASQNFAGVFFNKVGDGTNDGLYDCKIYNFSAYGPVWSGTYNTWMGNYGTTVFGASILCIDENDFSDHTVSAINARGIGLNLTVTNNDLDGSDCGYANIFLREGTGTISGNNIHDVAASGERLGIYLYDAASGVKIDNSTAANTISNNYIGLLLAGTNGAVIEGNTFTGSEYRTIVIQQNSDGNILKFNTITMTGTSAMGGVYIGSESGGNIIGGNNLSDGNNITIPTNSTHGVHLPYTIHIATGGANDATLKNNAINNGARGVQIDGGNSGTYTIDNNAISNDRTNSGNNTYGIGVNSGNVVVTGNTLAGTQRPFECFGAGTITFTGNTLSGENFFGLNLGSYTGDPIVTGNAFLDFGGNGNVVWNQGAGAVNATSNWWGDLDPSDNVNNSGAGSLDYSPWWGANYVGDPHSTAWTWYTNDVIQDAISTAIAGDVVNVMAGSYSERLTIDKSLTLNGAKAGVDARTRNTTTGESILDGTGLPVPPYDAIMITNGVSDVIVDGFEIRNYAGSGLNGDGNAVSSYCMNTNTTGATNVTIQNNYIHDIAYNGILVGSENDNGTNMVVQSGWLIQKNKLSGFTYAGIELTNVINSQVKDNDIAAPATLFNDPGDAGVGIEIAARSRSKSVIAGTDIEVSGNTITGIFPVGSRAAINILSRTYASTSNASLNGVMVNENTITGATNVRAAVLAVAESRSDGPATIHTLSVTDNILDGNLVGVEIQDYIKTGGGTAGHTAISITENEIKNNTSTGLHLMSATSAAEISVTNNKVFSNSLFGINNEGNGILSANNNWWGNSTGPYHDPINTGGTGNAVSDNVSFIPWWCEATMNSACPALDPGNAIINTTTGEQYPPDELNDALAEAANGQTLYVAEGTVDGTTVNINGKTVYIIGTGIPGQSVLDGASPALTVTAGEVVVKNGIVFTMSSPASNDPTILVSGGSLTLRDCIIHEVNGYDQSCLKVTGGTVDAGTLADRGHNQFFVHGAGSAIDNEPLVTLPAIGNDWGSTNGPTIDSNPGGDGGAIIGAGKANVDYDPWGGGPKTFTATPTVCYETASVDVPVTVTSFNDIGDISLTMSYDNTKLTTPTLTDVNAAISAWGTFTSSITTATGIIGVSAYGPLQTDGISLADNSTLFILHFTIISGTVTTPITFVENTQGTSCEYGGVAPAYHPYGDQPTATNYINGSVTVNTMTANTVSSAQTICTGGTAALTGSTVTSNGGVITYQWQSCSTESGTYVNVTPGGTETNYTTNELTSDTWFRRVSTSVLNTISCSNESTPVKITVVADPSITVQPVNPTNICAGGTSGTITISATGGCPSLAYQWQYYNGASWENVADGTPSGSVYSGSTGTSFSVTGIGVAGSYQYQCSVSASGNGCATVISDPVTVTVASDPSWATNSVSQSTTCVTGNSVTMNASVTGGLGGTISWIRATTPGEAGTTVTSPDSPGAGTWYYRPHYEPTGTGCDLADGVETTITFYPLRTISGNFTYYNLDNTTLTNVTVGIYQNNTQIGSDYSVTAGTYSFTNLCPGTYEVRATSSGDTEGSVNTTDAAQVNYWGVSPYNVEKVRFYAGDVKDNNNYLNASDAQRIQQYFVTGGATGFDRLAWTFWKTGEFINSNPTPFTAPDYPTVVVVGDANVTANFYGLCTGDFNRSFIPGLTKAGSSTLQLIYGNTKPVHCGQEFLLPVRIVNSAEVGAISLILNFPDNLVAVKDVLMNEQNQALDWAVNGNELRIGWYSDIPLNLATAADLVILRLQTTTAFKEGDLIRFELAADPLNELADGQYKVIADAVLCVDVPEASPISIEEWNRENGLVIRNHPNPFNNFTIIEYSLPFDGEVTLEIHTMLGKTEEILVNELQKSGNYLVKFNAGNLLPGVYTATIKLTNATEEIIQTIKLINNR